MLAEVKTLGQQPIKVMLAEAEVTIYPPSAYRVFDVFEAFLKSSTAFGPLLIELGKINRESENADSDALKAVKSGFTDFVGQCGGALNLICADQSGNIPDAIKAENFWREKVSMTEVAGLVSLWIDLTGIEELGKNVSRLTGVTRGNSRGPESSRSALKHSIGG